MIMRMSTLFAVLLLSTSAANVQQRLTSELYKEIAKGRNTLTEAEVLKLVPSPATIKFSQDSRDEDYRLTWEEVCRIRVEFLNDKATTVTGTSRTW